jgi:hypothetical protein
MHGNTTHSPSLTLNTKMINSGGLCSSGKFSLAGLVIKSWLSIRFGKVMWVFKAVFSGLGTLVEESGQERYWAHAVAGGFAVVLQVGLWVSHVGPEVGVGRELGLVLVGLGTLHGKVEDKSGPPGVQAVKVEVGQGMLIVDVVLPRMMAKAFFWTISICLLWSLVRPE